MFKYILSVFILLILLFSVIIYNAINSFELVPHPEKYEIDYYHPETVIFEPDTSISGISLFSNVSYQDFLKGKKQIPVDGGNDNFVLIFTNIGETQLLKLYEHPEQQNHQFTEFEITKPSTARVESFLSANIDEFISETGIKMDMTIGQVKSIKGEPKIVNVDESEIQFTYILNDSIDKGFLKRHDIPIYYSEFNFTEGYLTKYKFGTRYQ
ncbi:hypothetical protein [Flammeovirga pacifica]|nr:hypothetical protein [Flammeovirga pacifica]